MAWKASLDAECEVRDLVMLSVYPIPFGTFVPKLPECPKYHKASITQLPYGLYAWIKLDFHSNILDNQYYYCPFTDVESHVSDVSDKFLGLFLNWES